MRRRSSFSRRRYACDVVSEDSEETQQPVRELIENYRTLLNELALLTTVSVLLFGFLLASPELAGSGVWRSGCTRPRF